MTATRRACDSLREAVARTQEAAEHLRTGDHDGHAKDIDALASAVVCGLENVAALHGKLEGERAKREAKEGESDVVDADLLREVAEELSAQAKSGVVDIEQRRAR